MPFEKELALDSTSNGAFMYKDEWGAWQPYLTSKGTSSNETVIWQAQ